MKVRVAYTTDVPDWWRAEIRRFYGRDGLATREEIRDWLRDFGTSQDDDLGWAAQERDERETR